MGSPRHGNTSMQVEESRHEGAGLQKKELSGRDRVKNFNKTGLLNANSIGGIMLMPSISII